MKKDTTLETNSNQVALLSVVSNSRELAKQFGRLTVLDILKSKPPSLIALKNIYDDEKIEAAVAALIEYTFDGFGQVVKDSVLLNTANEVINGLYYWLSLEDLYVCFRDLQAEEFSVKLTPARLKKAIAKYAENRLDVSAEQSYSRHISEKPRELYREDIKQDFREQQRAAMRQYNFKETLKSEKGKLKK